MSITAAAVVVVGVVVVVVVVYIIRPLIEDGRCFEASARTAVGEFSVKAKGRRK